jgi:hypothetical protein
MRAARWCSFTPAGAAPTVTCWGGGPEPLVRRPGGRRAAGMTKTSKSATSASGTNRKTPTHMVLDALERRVPRVHLDQRCTAATVAALVRRLGTNPQAPCGTPGTARGVSKRRPSACPLRAAPSWFQVPGAGKDCIPAERHSGRFGGKLSRGGIARSTLSGGSATLPHRRPWNRAGDVFRVRQRRDGFYRSFGQTSPSASSCFGRIFVRLEIAGPDPVIIVQQRVWIAFSSLDTSTRTLARPDIRFGRIGLAQLGIIGKQRRASPGSAKAGIRQSDASTATFVPVPTTSSVACQPCNWSSARAEQRHQRFSSRQSPQCRCWRIG